MKMGEETDIAEPMPSENVVAAENVTANEPSKLKSSKLKKRKRRKALYKTLRGLMEFYLGDVNLSKDRFMSQQIQGQPFVYVNLSLFLTFNKIKALTKSVEELSKAIKKSNILELSEDGTQVCRKTPIKQKENEDECTIYVEQLGPQMDHNFLLTLFEKFGTIDYISMPRFPHTGKFKGFAFVEFKDPNIAKSALEAFKAKGCCLSPYMAPEDLMSIKSFNANKENHVEENKGELDIKVEDGHTTNDENSVKPKEECMDRLDKQCDSELREVTKTAKKDRKKRKHNEQNDNLKHTSSVESDEVESLKRRKKDKDCGSLPDKKVVNKKKKKSNKSISHEDSLSDPIVPKEENEIDVHKQENEIIVCKQEDEIFSPKQDNEVVDPDEKLEGKKRKRNDDDETMPSNEEEAHGSLKKKIKSNLQEGDEANHKTAKHRKKRLRKKVKQPSVYSHGLKVLSKKEWKQLRNKYLNMQRDIMRTFKHHLPNCQKPVITHKSEEILGKLQNSYESGTVLKVILEEPVSNVRVAKGEMRVHPDIRYVDATEDSPLVYLRTSTPQVATAILSAQHWPNIQLLKGDEESEYWNKIKMDREEYLTKGKSKRGRIKLLKRAELVNSNDINHFETF